MRELSKLFRGNKGSADTEGTVSRHPPSREDLYEMFWTGQSVEVPAGENIGKFCHSKTSFNSPEIIESLKQQGYERATPYTKGLNFKGATLQSIHKIGGISDTDFHELDFTLSADEGVLRMGAEFSRRDENSGSYELSIFPKTPEGYRAVFQERPPQEYLRRTFGLMYDILQRGGFIDESEARTSL